MARKLYVIGGGTTEFLSLDEGDDPFSVAEAWLQDGDYGDHDETIHDDLKYIVVDAAVAASEIDIDDMISLGVDIPPNLSGAETDARTKPMAFRALEYTTEKIIVERGRHGQKVLIHAHCNGGERGAYDAKDGNGVWHAMAIAPRREIDGLEALEMMRDWGYDHDDAVSIIQDAGFDA